MIEQKTKICVVCGEPFTPHPYHYKRAKYCSDDCSNKAKIIQRRARNAGVKLTEDMKTVPRVRTRKRLRRRRRWFCIFCGRHLDALHPRYFCNYKCQIHSKHLRSFFLSLDELLENPKFTPEQRKWLRDRSDENTIHFFRDELTKILNGKPSTDVLPIRIRRRLRNAGILTNRKGTNSATLTPRAENLLDLLEAQP